MWRSAACLGRIGRLDAPHYRRRDPTHDCLQHVEEFPRGSTEALRPDGFGRFRVGQLESDAQLGWKAADLTLKDVAHPQFAADPAWVNRAAVVDETGAARADGQGLEAGQLDDDVVGQAFGQIALLDLCPVHGEWQDSD